MVAGIRGSIGSGLFLSATGAIATVSAPVLAQPTLRATERFGDFPTATATMRAGQSTFTPAATPTVKAPTPLAVSGWQTFSSVSLRASLEYPPGWSAREDSAGVWFTSPSGGSIVLARVDTGDSSVQDYLSEAQLPNTRCTAGANAHGLAVRQCVDTLAFAHFAYVTIRSAGGGERLLSLSTRSRDAVDIFDAMLAALRATP